MTALAGVFSFGMAGAEDRCARMLRAQAIYGPHGEAQWSGGPVAMGRALYRLLPEDRLDRGPVVSADGARVLVADVRLDNRPDLGRELGLSVAEAGGLSDAALLMTALERWDEDALERLVGDFAFALWDAGRQRLMLARDPMGQRPLHHHRGEGYFAFASLPKGLHALEDIPRAARAGSVADFLALMPETGEESFFEGIDRTPAGYVTLITPGRVVTRDHGRPRERPIRFRRDADYAEALVEHLETAVRARLRVSGGAVATHLSAGLDSSSVAATAARLMDPDRLIAFTASPAGEWPDTPDSFSDEWPLAAATSALYPNIDHVRISPGAVSPLDGLDRNVFLYDRPLLNLCNAVWTDAINSAAQGRGVRVMLTGQMGNFSLSHAGEEVLAGLARQGRWLALARLAAALHAGGRRWRGVARLTLGPFLPGPAWRLARKIFGGAPGLEIHSALRASAVESFGIRRRAAERGLDPDYPPWADGAAMRRWGLRRVDLGNYNKGALAGWGVDYRDPTADRRVIEYCLNIPEEQFILGGQPRSLQRRAFAGRLPAAVLCETRKGAQGADWSLGLVAARPQLEAELARLAEDPQAAAVVDLERLGAALSNWPQTGWSDPETVRQYRVVLLRAVSAGHFLRRASGRNT